MNWKRFAIGVLLGLLIAILNLSVILSHPDPFHAQSGVIAAALTFALFGTVVGWMYAATVNFGRGTCVCRGEVVKLPKLPLSAGLASSFAVFHFLIYTYGLLLMTLDLIVR